MLWDLLVFVVVYIHLKWMVSLNRSKEVKKTLVGIHTGVTLLKGDLSSQVVFAAGFAVYA